MQKTLVTQIKGLEKSVAALRKGLKQLRASGSVEKGRDEG